MADRVMVYDGDIGEIYSDSNHPDHGFSNCDIDDKVLRADAYIVIAKNNWEILGEDEDGDIRVRTAAWADSVEFQENMNRAGEFWQYETGGGQVRQ
jgi:hypothetical protein